MKYMLLMNASKTSWESFGQMSQKDILAHVGFMKDLNDGLKKSGELLDAQGLSEPAQAKLVRAQAGGPPAVTDGPFPEAKEFLAGYWLVECSSERVVELAAYISGAPGKDGVPMNFPVEVRPLGVAPET